MKCLSLAIFYLFVSESYSNSIFDEDEISHVGETIVRNGTCDQMKTLVKIRFQTNVSTPYDLIEICHDEVNSSTLWSKHIIYGASLPGGSGSNPNFTDAGFYPNISVNDCYRIIKQRQTVGLLLKNVTLAEYYIPRTGRLQLSRGHLAPNGDQISPAQKDATYYFINASPQWRTINGGNWDKLENQLRKIAKNSNSTLTVWTGSHDIMTLNDSMNKPVEIWLGRDAFNDTLLKKLPVHKFTWKVVHDPATRTSAAVIMVNNPWLVNVPDKDVFCDDVCNRIVWVNWDTTNITAGYTFCCSVQSFHEKVNYAPNLGNLALMTSL